MDISRLISYENLNKGLNLVIKSLGSLIVFYVLYYQLSGGDGKTTRLPLEVDSIYMSDGRAISYRAHPFPTRERSNNIFCAEPAADFGVSSNKMHSFGFGLDKASADGELSNVTEIKKIYDRAHNIQLLRDVLYRSCEAYANGLIEHDVYSKLFKQTVMTSTILMGTNKIKDINKDNSPFASLLFNKLDSVLLESDYKDNLSDKPVAVLYDTLKGLTKKKEK